MHDLNFLATKALTESKVRRVPLTDVILELSETEEIANQILDRCEDIVIASLNLTIQ